MQLVFVFPPDYMIPPATGTLPADIIDVQARLRRTCPTDFVIFSNAASQLTSTFKTVPEGVDAAICTDAMRLPRLEKLYFMPPAGSIYLRYGLYKLGQWNPVRYLNAPAQPKKAFVFMGFEDVQDETLENCLYTEHRVEALRMLRCVATYMEKYSKVRPAGQASGARASGP